MGSSQSETQHQNGIYHTRTCRMTWCPGKLCKYSASTLLSFYTLWTPLDPSCNQPGLCKMTYRLASTLKPIWPLLWFVLMLVFPFHLPSSFITSVMYCCAEVLCNSCPYLCLCQCCRYLAGWGYLLSQDAVQLVVSRVELYEQQPDKAPGWFAGLHWEDVLVGLLLHEYAQPQNRPDGDLHLPVLLCTVSSELLLLHMFVCVNFGGQ